MSVRGTSNSPASHDTRGHAPSRSIGASPQLGGMASAAGGGGLSPSPNSNAARFRASIDAARTLYSGNSSNLQPGSAAGSPSLGSGFPQRSAGPGGSRRPASDLLNNSMGAFGNGPATGNIGGGFGASMGASGIAENDAIDKWFEDLHHYEATLEEMAAASLDQSFKEELGAIEQWFRVLSEAERTAALYSLLQTSSQVQIRFFITVLQQMARSDPMNALLSPANPQQASMEAQMEAKLASLGLKSPASPVIRQFARQSLGADAAAGFLSPSAAMLQPPQSARSVSGSSAPAPSSGNDDGQLAGDVLAQQRAKLNANAANRISAPGSLLSADNSVRSPLWSQANSEQVAEHRRSPSPDARSRPASMISDHGLPSHAAGINRPSSSASATSATAGNAANNLSPNLVASSGARFSGGPVDINSGLHDVAGAQLSPMMVNPNWAAMMNTPLMSSFGPNNNNAGDASGSFPNLAAAMAAASGLGGNDKTNWASQSQNANGIVLDDAKKFRRNRASDAGLEDAVPGVLSGMYDPAKQSNGNGNARGNATAMAAQQNWRKVNGLSQNQGQGQTQQTQTQNSPLPPSTASMHSPDLSNLANLAAMQGMQSPQVAMANLLAAQQQIQQQMQLQQMMGMAGMSSPMNMNMMSALQNQQMLSPALAQFGMMGMPQSASSNSSAQAQAQSQARRSPRPQASSGVFQSGGAFGGAGAASKPANATAPVVPGSGVNPDEAIDLSLLSDVAAWLRSLRLHKYTTTFERSNWREMVAMDDAALEAKGVAALGARRKLLKVFENVRNAQGIPHPPGTERSVSPNPGAGNE